MSVEIQTGPAGVAYVRMLDVAGHNGLSEAFVSRLLAALGRVGADPNVRVIVLAGTERWFCSGATRQMLHDVVAHRIAPAELTLAQRVVDLPVPVIAAARGDTLGGGLALMLACDLRVVATTSRHCANFMTLGITPGMGTTALLRDALGPALADELQYTGKTVRGDALPPGSVNAVVDPAAVEAAAADLAWQLAAHPRDNLRLLKRTLTLPRRRALLEANTLESLMHESSLTRFDEDNLP